VVQVDDPTARELPTNLCGQYPHVASQNQVVDLILVEGCHEGLVVRAAFTVTDHPKVTIELVGQESQFLSVRKHDRNLRVDRPVGNRLQNRSRRMLDESASQRQSWFLRRPAIRWGCRRIRAPGANRQSGVLADLPHFLLNLGELDLGIDGRRFIELDPTHHREQRLLVVIVHLNLRYPSPTTGQVVDDRISQTCMVRPQCGNDNFHAKVTSNKEQTTSPRGRLHGVYEANEVLTKLLRHYFGPVLSFSVLAVDSRPPMLFSNRP